MSATILAFPGVDLTRIRARPTSIQQLSPGAKALAVIADGDRFAVVMRPAVTPAQRAIRQSFSSAREALGYARRLSASFPSLYQIVLDETPRDRTSLDELLGPGPDPMDFGGTA